MTGTHLAPPTGSKPVLRLTLADSRGFCAGVVRAVQTVERALDVYGPPVYVRHEIVHNRHVVARLAAMGAVFVEDLDDLPTDLPGDRPVIFSAHGAPLAAYAAARARGVRVVDATCPLVSKVHADVTRHAAGGRHVFLIGHAGHPEIVATASRVDADRLTLVETEADAHAVDVPDGPSAYATQTTLSVDDVARIIAVLTRRVPGLIGPRKEDVCYATTNRQAAVKRLAPFVDRMLVVGAENSSNSQRLVETAIRAGCPATRLVSGRNDLDWDDIGRPTHVGVTAGASTPHDVTDDVVAAFATRFDLMEIRRDLVPEPAGFGLPRELRTP